MVPSRVTNILDKEEQSNTVPVKDAPILRLSREVLKGNEACLSGGVILDMHLEPLVLS
jgi:hypothetical protein